jgi:signal transduction histidine kinase
VSTKQETLLPPINWWPMVFSIFVVYLPNGLGASEHTGAVDVLFTALGILTFLTLVVTAAVCWRKRRPFLWVSIPFTVLGVASAAYYPAASVLCFIFAACLIPWAVNGNAWRTARLVSLVIGVILCQAWLAPPGQRKQWLIAALFCATASALYVWVVRMSLNAHRLAMLAERERIAGDLNGLLGQTLALVASKAALAATEPARARDELATVESLSRQALADVRGTIRGYRAETLDREVQYAPAVLRTSGHSIPSILWWPVLISLFIAYLPGGLEMSGGASPLQWIVTGAGMVVFVALLAASVAFWRGHRPLTIVAILLALVTVTLVPYEEVTTLSPEFDTFLKLWWWFSIPIFSALCAAGFICVMSMSLGVHRLAKVAERERIARDLHDVLGHTLSLITLKAELGGRLLAQGGHAGRVREEITDIERVARHGLAEIRAAIGGNAVDSFDAELESAVTTLQTAGVEVSIRHDAHAIAAAQEGVLALVLREAVTNVVRHARATRCCISVQKARDQHVLDVSDDGQGGAWSEGLGLRGIRERVESVGGSVSWDTAAGTHLTVNLPATR